MKPTEQQQDIVDTRLAVGEVMSVVALAGTGKTSCLVMYADTVLDKKVLYLAYNKSMATEAAAKFPNNVVCKTTHSLCWGKYGSVYKNAGKLDGNIYLKDIMTYLRTTSVKHYLKGSDAWPILRAAKFTVDNFVHSAEKEIKASMLPLWYVKKGDSNNSAVIKVAKELWEGQINTYTPLPITHDHYMKLFQLECPKLPYDIIMLDEAQDSNPCTVSIVTQQLDHCSAIFVGDPYQQIYAFRGSVDTFSYIDATYERRLTNSFRFGEAVADVANGVLCGFFEESEGMSGLGCVSEVKDTSMLSSDLLEDYSIDSVFIARTNGTLVARAIQAMLEGYTFGFAGGFDKSVYFNLQELHRLKVGEFVKHPLFSNFQDVAELRMYVDKSEDREVASLLRIYDVYGPKILSHMRDIMDNEVKFRYADIKLTTAHKSKGLEFDKVYIAPDMVPSRDAIDNGDKSIDDLFKTEDANLLYVAITRCKEGLLLDSQVDSFMQLAGMTS